MPDLTPDLVSDIRLGERRRITDILLRIASAADREPSGLSYEGGIPSGDIAIILRAAVREIDRTPLDREETKSDE